MGFISALPETEQTGPSYIGESNSELEFPRRLERANVTVYSGSRNVGEYGTIRFAIELLAPNVIKITDRNRNTRVIYNATIDVAYY